MYRLLIADDEKIERLVLARTLQKNFGGQCQIFEAGNGREALEIYDREQIQIAILDIEMPGINGIEAAERIRERDDNCCIIFLTAFDEFSYARKAITVRALDYLLKPYDEEELVSVVEEGMRMADAGKIIRQIMKITGLSGAGKPEERESESAAAPNGQREDDTARQHRTAEAFRDYVQQNYQEDISMQDAARAMGYSEAYFCKLFKQCFGKNFTAYLTEYRVDKAKKLLRNPLVNVRDVSNAVGYADSNYFTKVFKRMTGQSPTEYRKSLTMEGSG